MTLDTINTLLNLKENETIELGEVFPSIANKKISITHYYLNNFEDFLIQFQSEIIACSLGVIGVFNNEIKEDIKNEKIKNILKFNLTPSTDGFKLEITSEYLNKYMTEIRDGNFRENIDTLIDLINSLKNNISKNINSIIDKHVELSEVGQIKQYTLLYEHGRQIKRTDFVRGSDRPIFEQKAEIQDLINRDITGYLYDTVTESNPELIGKQFAIQFTLIDNKDIEDIKFGTY